ncbi:MAG: hypothetical protein JXA72_12500 [Bacteroidales bacterium]|nr:hypothetical protein [Bacteroidales bacterium]
MSGRINLTIMLFLSLTWSLFSQVPSLRINYFPRENGLLSSSITSITQDSTGFIWISSRDGLYKYDGYGFTGYFSKQDDSTSIPSNHINHLFLDSKDRLWIATAMGVCYYNKDLDNFIRVADPRNDAGLEGINIPQISEDLKGNILITCVSSILRYDFNEKVFKKVVSVDSCLINHFIVDNVNRIWIGCSDNRGLIRYNPNTMESKVISATGPGETMLNNSTINRLALQDNKLWMAVQGAGVWMFNTTSGKLIQYHYLNEDDAVAINVYIDNSDKVWTVDYAGLKVFDVLSDSLTAYLPDRNDPHAIRHNVKGIFQDRQGNHWIYHEPGGVGIYLAPKGFNQLYNNPAYNKLASGGNVTAIQADSKDRLWFGYFDGGISVVSLQNGDTIRFRHNEKDKFSVARGTIFCIFCDSKGTMWVGSYFGGLQYYDEKKNRFYSYTHDPKDPNSIAGNDIRSIAEDAEGNFWIAVHAKGVDKFDRKLRKFTHFNSTNSNLSNNWPFEILIDNQGDLWVGTAWGLNLMKRGETSFRSYMYKYDDTTSLSNNFVVDLYEGGDHTLWIGTSSGLNRYNRDLKNFTRFQGAFANNSISGIISGDKGILWISNISGLAMFNTENGEVRNFGYVDGLNSEEFNPRSCYKNRYNEFFFGGIRGIDVFDPEQLRFNTEPPAVIIDKLRIFNKELTVANSDKLKKQVSRSDEITLKHTDKVIAINFKALNFINPQMNRYAYKLEGFEENWNFVGTGKEATYTNLNPGEYTFRVIACNNDGVWNHTGASLKIEILPPWYGTLAFKIVSVIFVLGSIAGFITLRTSKLKKQKIRLEETVRQKTSELYEKNELLKIHAGNLNEVNHLLLDRQNQLKMQSEELQQQTENLAVANKELQKLNSTKDKLFSVIAHDLSSPFNTIIGFSDLLVTHFDSISDEEKLTYAKAVRISSERVFTLLQNLLLWARSQTNRIRYHPQEIMLQSLIQETIELGAERINEKEIRVEVDCPSELKVTADIDMLKTVFRNLFSNALKYSPRKGVIQFKAIAENGEASISVSDNGVGMKPEKVDELLSANIVTPVSGTEGEKGSGLGLTLCKDFIKMNKGILHIYSTEGKGSTFEFSLPLAAGNKQ